MRASALACASRNAETLGHRLLLQQQAYGAKPDSLGRAAPTTSMPNAPSLSPHGLSELRKLESFVLNLNAACYLSDESVLALARAFECTPLLQFLTLDLFHSKPMRHVETCEFANRNASHANQLRQSAADPYTENADPNAHCLCKCV
eukprot:823696-Amphidinium_carterae.1